MNTLKRTRHEPILSVNAKVARDINRSLVLNLIREKQPISRAAVARLTKLNKSTVSSIVATLLTEDLIAEESKSSHRVGRTPLNLHLKTGKHLVGAVYIDSVSTAIGVVDVDGSVRALEEVATDPRQPIDFVRRCLERLDAQRVRAQLPALQGTGLTIAGIVDPVRLRVVYAPNLGWEQVDLGEIMRKHSPATASISVENDARASALAEIWFGNQKVASTNFVFVSVGPGIGTGIVINNRILSGSFHAAGEFGHMTIVEGGELCSCGNRGCLEAYASDRATTSRYLKGKGLPPDHASSTLMPQIIQAAMEGDEVAKDALLTSARYLGVGIANIIRTFDPECIVLGGLVTRAWDMVYPELTSTMRGTGRFGGQRSTSILPSSLSASPPLLGAAALSLRKIFTDFRVAL